MLSLNYRKDVKGSFKVDGQSLSENTDYTVTFFAGEHLLCGLVVNKINSHTMEVAIFRDTAEQIEIALDILEACWTVMASQSRVSKLERYQGLGRRAADGDEGEVLEIQSPTDDQSDIPF